MTIRLTELTSFRHEAGYCWIAVLPSHLVFGDAASRPSTSKLILFEDGRALGPWRAPHDVIRKTGCGAFSHWGTELWLSASDNTSPKSNGRRYAAVAVDSSIDELGHDWRAGNEAVPVNFQPLIATAENIERDAQYAISVAQSYVDALPDGSAYLSKRSVLELGPGHHFGSALVMLCWGASRVAVADRFLVPFHAEYHSALYKRLETLLIEQGGALTLAPIRECVERKRHLAPGLAAVAAPLEDLSATIDEPFDITASNAVFEHLFDPFRAIRSLYKLTKSGGIGLHQVDFRDHRTMSRPLEFLLDDERSFALVFEQNHGEMGSRLRPFQMEAMFRDAGFSIVEFKPNMIAEPEYLEDFVPRLRGSSRSSYRDMAIEYLRPISGRFVVRKVADPVLAA